MLGTAMMKCRWSARISQQWRTLDPIERHVNRSLPDADSLGVTTDADRFVDGMRADRNARLAETGRMRERGNLPPATQVMRGVSNGLADQPDRDADGHR